MKSLLLSTALAAGLVLPAFAQTNTNSPFRSEMTEGTVPASDLIGARIYAAETAIDSDAYEGVQEGWNDIGEVNEVILSREGQVDSVIVDIGGFLGMGERQVAVDMAALRFVQDSATDADDWFLVMQADRATLEGAPAWTMGAMDPADTTTGDPDAAVPGVNEAQSDPQGGMTGDTVASEADTATGTTTAGNETGMAAAPGEMVAREGYAPVDVTALSTEMLTGATIYDTADASIGEVSDFVLTEDGQITNVVVDVGGFLGIGEKRVALAMEQLQIMRQDAGDEVRIYVPMTREELEALPPIDS